VHGGVEGELEVVKAATEDLPRDELLHSFRGGLFAIELGAPEFGREREETFTWAAPSQMKEEKKARTIRQRWRSCRSRA